MPSRHSPVPQNLTMDSHSTYRLFKKYILSAYELKKNDFPTESSRQPGKIQLDCDSIFHRWHNTRLCTRCKQSYENNFNPANDNAMPCFYHPKKLNFGTSTYPCCYQAFMSPGCTRGKHHVSVECDLSNVQFKKTRSGRSTYACNVFALDCEMVYTTGGLELAKVGIIGVDGNTLYESFVVPEKEILDYNTEYSGVTSKDLQYNAVSFSEAQEIVLGFVNADTILVGHGLENDLRALRLIHSKVVDTSVLFPHQRARYKRSLKSLAKEFLDKDIQMSADGHDCTEDARTALELVFHKYNVDMLSAHTLAHRERSVNQVNMPSPAPLSNRLNLHESSMGDVGDIVPPARQSFVSGLNSTGTRSLSQQGGPKRARTQVVWSDNGIEYELDHDTRTFVKVENDRNVANTTFTPNQIHTSNSSGLDRLSTPEYMQEQLGDLHEANREFDAWAQAQEMPEDVLVNLYMRQQIYLRSISASYFNGYNAGDRHERQPATIQNSCQPNVFGVMHKGEWYPVRRLNPLFSAFGHVSA